MKSIIMTGGTAGIGLAAARRMRGAPEVRLLVGARGETPAGALPLDLARLADVRRFAAEAEAWLGSADLDALVLNAGLQTAGIDQRTDDGFEITFAVNHLAHYLLLRLLAPRLSQGAVVVITTSDLHDPDTNRIAPPAHADAALLARGQVRLDPGQRDLMAVMRAYSASKLCNLLTARAFAASDLAKQRQVRVAAYNPGFTPGTRLTRNHPLAFRLPFAVLAPLIGAVRRLNTVEGGGALLADLALGRIVPPPGRLFASQVRRQLTWPDPSRLAGDDAVMDKLWHDSAALVGVAD